MEEYRIIEGYEDYVINNVGKVKRGEKEIKSFVLPNGYARINLYKDGVARQLSIHRLVAIAFISKPPSEKHVVNHKNSIRSDNRVENLEWMTTSENVKYGYSNGLVDREKNYKQLESVRLLANKARNRKIQVTNPNGDVFVFESAVKAGEYFGLSNVAIGNVARGKRNHHKGYIAKYL